MELLTVVSPVFGARTSVLVADDGACVVVDAGALVADAVVSLVEERGLVPQGVLVTHGHADHVWDAGPLARRLGVAVHVHARDAYRLVDPFGTLGVLGGAAHDPSGPLAQSLAAVGADPAAYERPDDLSTFGTPSGADEGARERDDDVRLELGPVVLVARHAPGHTEGSTLYLVDGVAFTGDVLFAGTVGRTDLPGGDPEVMARTLREVVARLDPATRVVPGHGPTSDVARELATNPFLAGGFPAGR
ncbi:MBL fold metallo-hydrolase [Cellulomonas palmilytica]|uniref:MBL fold metallo-hydrolase n=1 Tax=Cellulomonas palmilytica TaxID=2608402 RepID=UPI001F344493|nr:MBL fold metallo-hydrolase [Cellulomonas palmilytica]UJP39090.1 MBL fold metallo-hydrolase [Cellulomonas palmilytica]